jgi:hypothetical protein
MSFIGSGSCDMNECHWVYFTKKEEEQLAMLLQLTPVRIRGTSDPGEFPLVHGSKEM